MEPMNIVQFSSQEYINASTVPVNRTSNDNGQFNKQCLGNGKDGNMSITSAPVSTTGSNSTNDDSGARHNSTIISPIEQHTHTPRPDGLSNSEQTLDHQNTQCDNIRMPRTRSTTTATHRYRKGELPARKTSQLKRVVSNVLEINNVEYKYMMIYQES